MLVAPTNAPIGITVVIPIYNEEDNIPILYERLRAALARNERTWEAVLVNDGSTDHSASLLDEYAARDPRINHARVLQAALSRHRAPTPPTRRG